MAQVGGGSGDYPHTASGVTTAGFIQERQTRVQNPLPDNSVVHLYCNEKLLIGESRLLSLVCTELLMLPSFMHLVIFVRCSFVVKCH